MPPDWLTKIKTPSPERERGRKREGETGRKKIPDWFSLGHKFIHGAGGGKVTDSLTRSLPMGEGGSPKGYGGAVPKRRKKKKKPLAAPALTAKCLESSGPKCGCCVHVSEAVSFHAVTLQ